MKKGLRKGFILLLTLALLTIGSGAVLAGQASGPIAAGWSHTVALKSDGTVWAWGDNSSGQLGDGTFGIEICDEETWICSYSSPITPNQVTGFTDVTAVAAGYVHTIALKNDGTVWAWGGNSLGQLGDGTTTDRNAPVQVPGLTGVTAIAAGQYFTVALKNDGTVWTWGCNWYGALGYGTTANRIYTTPNQVIELTGVTAIAAEYGHTIALKNDGTAWTWGYNNYGQLGDGTGTDRCTPVQVIGLTGVTAVATGRSHTVALKNDGTVWAWGYNYFGQLGYGTTGPYTKFYGTPNQVPGLTSATAIAAGDVHTIALKNDGTVWAWGNNSIGQLGDGTITDHTTPNQVAMLTGVAAIAAGRYHSLALKNDGMVWTWGINESGQLGDNTTTNRSTPVQVFQTGFIFLNVTATVTGGNGTIAPASSILNNGGTATLTIIPADGYHLATLTDNGTNVIGSVVGDTYIITNVTAAHDVIARFAKDGFTVNVSVTGGNGTILPNSNPVVVTGGSTASFSLAPAAGYQPASSVGGTCPAGALSVTTYTTGAITADCSVIFSFVSTNVSTTTVTLVEPPNGSNPPASTTVSATFSEPMDPATITSGSFFVTRSVKIKAIAAGSGNTVVLKTDGTVFGWGDNSYGQTTGPPGLSGVVDISTGGYHSLALKNDGTVFAWGRNNWGESTVPPDLSGVVAISAGCFHSLALKNDGTVVAWGNNNRGQSTVSPGLSGVVAISAGYDYSLALKSDGTVVAWGNNNSGQASVPPGLSGVVAISAGVPLALKNDGTVVTWGATGELVPPGLSGVVAISGRMALKSDGTVVAWGNNSSGQATVPSGLSGVVAISAGGGHSVALKNDGAVVVWGNNSSRQATVPSGLGLSGAAAISASESHSLFLKSDGTVAAWGNNFAGQISVPPGLTGVVAISAGPYHSLALKNDGTVVAWGAVGYSYGQATVPPGLSGVVAISAGGEFSLALKNDGTVVAWGRNDYGQLSVPRGLSGVVAISAGGRHSLALRNDGTVVAWGAWGGTDWGQTTVPPGLSGVVAISAGTAHSLALKNDGTVVAWGATWSGINFGQTTVPPGLSGVVAISAGGTHSLALKNDGTAVAWGARGYDYGQATVPPDLSGVVAISAGNIHSLALKKDGTIVAWGSYGVCQSNVPMSPYETVVPGNVVYDQATNTAVFTPSAPLEPGFTYFATVTTGVRNLAGEHLAPEVRWSFTPEKANATIVLTNLNQAYDGTPRAVTATTDPSGLAVSITYNGSATPPTAVGSYTVAATITDAAYKGSANAILTITNPTYSIGVAVAGGNGSISCDTPVTHGGNSICSISPAANYHLATLTDNNVDKVGSVSANSYTIGNVTANHAILGTFAVDLTANAGPNQTIPCSGPTGAQVALDGSASTGAATYTWSGPFGSATGAKPTVTIPWGVHTVTLTVDDGAGMTAAATVVITVRDTTLPVAFAALNGTSGTNNWFVSAVTVNLTATDSCSGVKEIRYTLDGIDQPVVPGSSAAFNVATDGNHNVSYVAIDNENNPVTGNLSFNIDKTAPVITIVGAANGGTYNLGLVPPTSYTATDALSGVATSNFSLSGGDAQGLGQFTYTVTATDKAGNTTTAAVTYTVNATPTGTVDLIGTLPLDPQTAATLINSLTTALDFYAGGNSTAGDNKVGAFINQVNAPGRNIPPDIVAILINAANYIIAHN